MTKYAETHEDWVEALKGTARCWHRKYPYLDEEEMFSELLVAYAEALRIPLQEGVKFDTVLMWQKRAVLQKFLREAHKASTYGYTVQSYEELLENGIDIEIIHDILVDVDTIPLDADALKVLEFLMEHGVSCDNAERRRVGVATVARDLVRNIEGITMHRARKALYCLYNAYVGCVTV
jgi:hypothetical protein